MGSKAPDPVDPKETGAAQTSTNVTTALANAQLNNVNQYGPNGSKTYSTSGSKNFTDPTTGASYNIPQYNETTTLSDAQQRIKDQNDGASFNLASLGNDLSGTLGSKLKGNFSLGNEETESRLYELGSKRIQPTLDEGRRALETRLADQGIGHGTEAYDRAIGLYGQKENDAYNQLALNGRGQASQELLAEDNQRINQIGALLSQGQVSQPTFGATNNNQIPTVDYAGLVNQQYNQQAAQASQSSGLWGNLIGAAGKIGSVALSDERAKKDKVKVGEVEGMGLYDFRYKGAPAGSPKQRGLMAQEVKKKKPGAVSKGNDGLYRVDYGKALK